MCIVSSVCLFCTLNVHGTCIIMVSKKGPNVHLCQVTDHFSVYCVLSDARQPECSAYGGDCDIWLIPPVLFTLCVTLNWNFQNTCTVMWSGSKVDYYMKFNLVKKQTLQIFIFYVIWIQLHTSRKRKKCYTW